MAPAGGRAALALAYATVYLVWGSTYFAIRAAVAGAGLPPAYVVGGRFLAGGLALLLAAALAGRWRRPGPRAALGSAVQGCLLLLGGNGLVTLAERRADSSLAALIVSCTPVAVALFDRALFRIRIGAPRALGIACGLAGVAVLVGGGARAPGAWSADLMVLGGMASWALGMSLGKAWRGLPDPLANSGFQMALAGALCLAGFALADPAAALTPPAASPRAWWALAYLAVAGSLAYCAFIYLLGREPNSRVVSYAFVNPVIAVALGVCLGGERPGRGLWLALPLVLAGLALVFYGEALWGMSIGGRAPRVGGSGTEGPAAGR